MVGNLHLNPLETLARDLDQQFLQQQVRWIYGTAVFAFLLAGVLAVAFSRQIVSPISKLTRGTQALANGRFTERLTVRSSDELGGLARNFNVLAETLERNQQAQRQWVADISHELRTPLSVLRGELQAVEDGVRAFDEATRKSLSGEVDRLTKLVNDIYQLSVADVGALRYRKEVADVGQVLEDTVDMFEARIRDAGLEMETRYSQGPLEALIDVNRLGQLFTNVLENTVRYTDRGGRVRVACTRQGKDIVVIIEDSAPSVPADALPRLFEAALSRGEFQGPPDGRGGTGSGHLQADRPRAGWKHQRRALDTRRSEIDRQVARGGSCVRMTVPGATAPSGSPVLVVEDEPKIAQLLVDYLLQASYPAHHIGNGEEVVPWVRGHDPPADACSMSCCPAWTACRSVARFADFRMSPSSW